MRLLVYVRSQWIGALALFLVLAGGTAWAANEWTGQNIVNESLTGADIKNGTVKGPDVLESSLTLPAEPWHRVGAAGQPAFNQTASCRWSNYDSVHSQAAFLRDAAGIVHLKGTVRGVGSPNTDDCALSTKQANRIIFTLPPGYRPAKREAMATLTGALSGVELGAVVIDGPALAGFNAGAVWAGPPTDTENAFNFVYLDGVSFRCEPSGANGCP
jgi:hypothetical protein